MGPEAGASGASAAGLRPVFMEESCRDSHRSQRFFLVFASGLCFALEWNFREFPNKNSEFASICSF